MTLLKLHSEIYASSALAQTLRQFEGFGSFNLFVQGAYFEISVTSEHPSGEERLVAEFANYALAVTVEHKRVTGACAPRTSPGSL